MYMCIMCLCVMCVYCVICVSVCMCVWVEMLLVNTTQTDFARRPLKFHIVFLAQFLMQKVTYVSVHTLSMGVCLEVQKYIYVM